jgi:hypothetical protein
MTSIFTYVTVCSFRNSWRLRLQRLRQPRYLLIAVGFVLYIGSMILSRRSSGVFGVGPLNSTRARSVAVGVATLLLASAWVLPVAAALRFTSAEIQFLFTGPITRRQLIGYKLSRILFGAAGTGAFLTVFVGPAHLVPALAFAVKSALIVMILTLHGVGVATYRSNAKDVARLPPRRWPIVAAACLLTPLAGAGLVFIAFSSAMQFMAALPIAALIAGVNVLWIVQTDVAFEDAATDAADKMNRRAATGQVWTARAPRKGASRFRLAPRGPAETAILWKNWMLLGRGSRHVLVTAAIMLASLLVMFFAMSGGVLKADLIGDGSLFAVGVTVLLGPALLRVDLRQDLTHLALIKTWPVRGAALIRGELLAPAIALSGWAAAAIVIGSAFAPHLPFVDGMGIGARATFALAAVLSSSAIITAQFVVHNGIAVCFPAWVELKAVTGTAAMEMNVRMMIVMYGSMIILVFGLLLPAGAGFTVYELSGGLLMSSVIFAALVAAESFAAIEVLGRVLDSTDLHDVVVAE